MLANWLYPKWGKQQNVSYFYKKKYFYNLEQKSIKVRLLHSHRACEIRDTIMQMIIFQNIGSQALE